MTITTSSLVHDGGKATDFVSDRIQAAEAALAQLTQPSRTTNFVGCSEAPIVALLACHTAVFNDDAEGHAEMDMSVMEGQA